jgi:hypothetical protein
MFAFIAGIESPEVLHLEVTRRRLPSGDRATLRYMNEVVDWRSQHEEYKKALGQSQTAVPYFGNVFALRPHSRL